jgi:hypothetical protein
MVLKNTSLAPKDMDHRCQIATITREIDQIRQKELDLCKKRENLLIEEAQRYTEAAQPSAATQIAQALINVYTESDVSLETLFGVQSPEVNTAGLLLQAEWRDPHIIEMFLNNGADVNGEDDQGFSVLEMVLQGHDGHWRGESNHWNEEVFKVLAKYNVRSEISHGWIIEQCCDGAPKYVRDFLGLDDDANEDAVESRRVV